jgi:DNA-binding PadR family transcriptional regulator
MPRGLSFAAVTVLSAVASGSRHGFDIIEATGLPSGTVYPALGRLERDGFVRSSWEDPAAARREKRPPRRYYRVTAHGTRVLEGELAKYRTLGAAPRGANPARGRG